MDLINWKMISHPMNWITFFLMVAIAAAIGHTLLTYLGHEPATASSPRSGYADMPAGQSPGEVATGAISQQFGSDLPIY